MALHQRIDPIRPKGRQGFQVLRLLILALMICLIGPGAQAQQKVDLELILMVDGSGSIDDDEFILQRLGYAKAFRNPRVGAAIRNGALGKIAVSYVEWTGPFLQISIVPWTVLGDKASIESFATRLEVSPRELFTGGTAVGNAILYGAQSIKSNKFQGKRRVIDISGDGQTNRGYPAALARDQVVAQGNTVNGLPILNNDPELDVFFLTNVIGGPGAFSIPAKTFKDFNSAILNKLIREIAAAPNGNARQAAAAGADMDSGDTQ
jgi:hypothetical protein